jgi:aspartate racemase
MPRQVGIVARSTEGAALSCRTICAEGCDAVVLGCTEISLLVGDRSSPLPVLDSTRLPVRAALNRAARMAAADAKADR